MQSDVSLYLGLFQYSVFSKCGISKLGNTAYTVALVKLSAYQSPHTQPATQLIAASTEGQALGISQYMEMGNEIW